jgi:hypothetical protein
VLALVSSLLLIVYLLIPEAAFRLIFNLFVPVRNFVLSRTETVYRGALIASVPFLAAYLMVWFLPFAQRHPFHFDDTVQLRRADYKVLVSAMYSEQEFSHSKAEFWPALTRASRRQGRLLTWYLIWVIFLAVVMGIIARNIPNWRTHKGKRRYALLNLLSDKILFPYISQWHVLLTPFMVPGSTIQADILCVDGSLYKGEVSAHFLNEGQLSGIILTDPVRFDRSAYLKEKDAGKKPDKNNFWTSIPSAKLYFFADKVLNMNLRYATPAGIKEFVAENIGDTGISITINPGRPPSMTPAKMDTPPPPKS